MSTQHLPLLAQAVKAPKMDDAYAVTAVVSADPRVEQVFVIGSVSRGDASELSDIDLLVLTEDYPQGELKQICYELGTKIWGKSTHPVDMIIRKRSEFEYMSKHVTASFEHNVTYNAISLYKAEPNPDSVKYNVQVVPRDNLVLGMKRARSARRYINLVLKLIQAIPNEETKIAAIAARQESSEADIRKNRYAEILEQAHMGLEQSVRSLAATAVGAALGGGHQLHAYLDNFPNSPEKESLTEILKPLWQHEAGIRSWRSAAYVDDDEEWEADMNSTNTSRHLTALVQSSMLAVQSLRSKANGRTDLLDAAKQLKIAAAELLSSPISAKELETGI